MREEAAKAETLDGTTTEVFAYGQDDSSEARKELLRRYEVPLPLPLQWYHGGLNE